MTILGLLYLFVPLVTIVVFTFNDPTSKFNTDVGGVHVGQLAATRSRRRRSPTP